jgi:hypothetical protein
MNPETIAQIILKALELAIIIAQSIPPEEHAKFWERHNKNMELLERIFTLGKKTENG